MKIDMSPHSITMRIIKCSELRRLCIALGGDRLKERFRKPQIRTVEGESSKLKAQFQEAQGSFQAGQS